MKDLKSNTTGTKGVGINRVGAIGIAREFGLTLIHLAILLISAGKLDWINAWAFTALSLIYQAVNTIVLMKYNPQLLNKRGQVINENTKSFDKMFIAFYIPLAVAGSVVVGLDAVRYRWSEMSPAFIIPGVIILIIVWAFGSWAMAENPHFEATVIVGGVEHKICSSGPYRIVRHPGYAAAIIGALSYPLILGSWWGLIPVVALDFLFVIRTALEDNTLQRELPGYREYASATRYRLVPFVW